MLNATYMDFDVKERYPARTRGMVIYFTIYVPRVSREGAFKACRVNKSATIYDTVDKRGEKKRKMTKKWTIMAQNEGMA